MERALNLANLQAVLGEGGMLPSAAGELVANRVDGDQSARIRAVIQHHPRGYPGTRHQYKDGASCTHRTIEDRGS